MEMESSDIEPTDNCLDREKGSRNTLELELEVKAAELREIKEELKRAKDNATESWLDSKPLIDELETLKADLAIAQNQFSISNNVILELELQLETIVKDIRSKREEELKATKVLNEMNRTMEQTREELEQLKADKAEEQRARTKLKQTLRLRRQTLRTLQLTLRAVRIESEAFGASAAEALGYMNHLEPDNSPVQLNQEEYYALKRRAKEESSLADWRISVAIEQKGTAEAGRNLALTRLQETHPNNRPRRRRKTEDKTDDDEEDEEIKPDQSGDTDQQGTDQVEVENREYEFPKARARAIAEYKQGKPNWTRQSKSRKNKAVAMKKKVSIFGKIKSCLFRVKRLFR